MTEKKLDNGFEPERNICEFLGLKEDPATNMAYPSEWNYCHHSNPIAIPMLDHQRLFCLLKSHNTCPEFNNEVPAILPVDIRMVVKKRRRRTKKPWVVALILGVIVVGGLFIGTRLLTRPLPLSDMQPTMMIPSDSTPAGFVIINPYIATKSASEEIATPQNTVSAIPKPSVTPQLGTETPSSAIHGLDMPIGTAHRFVIHRIQQGESLGGLAIQYNTTVEAITLVNYYMPDPVWINWLVVIPVDTSNVIGLPSFDAYMVVDGGISIESLAKKLVQDASNLIFYNGLEPGYFVSSGEWLLIPHIGE
jgi:hypothetical protein